MVYRLRLSDAEMFADRRVDVGLQVKKGETLAGRTFEQHAGLEMNEQPDVLESEQGGGTSWSPRVYGVTVTTEKDQVRYDHGVASTVRVSFGQPSGGQLSGARTQLRGRDTRWDTAASPGPRLTALRPEASALADLRSSTGTASLREVRTSRAPPQGGPEAAPRGPSGRGASR